jgi:transposase
MSAQFKAVDRETLYLLPPSVQEWLPEKHLARFVVDVVSKLDLHELKMPYTGVGSEAFHPEMLLVLLFYGYATGVFSSRKLEQGTYDSLAFRYIAANTHPDHDTIAHFRQRFLGQLKPLFLQILLLAKALGFFKMGKISLDGSKIQANASKHSALSWGHATELEQQLKEEITRLLAMAEAADTEELPDGMDIPSELARREERLKAIAEAKAKLEARAAERHAVEQAEYETQRAEREAKAKARGRPPKGPEPKAPEPGPRDSDQINLTDEQSRIMPASGLPQRPNYPLHCGWTRTASPASGTALDRTDHPGARCRPRCGDETPAEDSRRPRHLWATQMYGRAGVWHYQIGAGLPPVSAVWAESRQWGMDAGQHWLESGKDAHAEPAATTGSDGIQCSELTRQGNLCGRLLKIDRVAGIFKAQFTEARKSRMKIAI